MFCVNIFRAYKKFAYWIGIGCGYLLKNNGSMVFQVYAHVKYKDQKKLKL